MGHELASGLYIHFIINTFKLFSNPELDNKFGRVMRDLGFEPSSLTPSGVLLHTDSKIPLWWCIVSILFLS